MKLFNSQLDKLQSRIKNGTAITLNLSPNLIDDFNNETNFSHKLLLANAQVPKLCKTFENVSSANIQISKAQLSRTDQSGGFLGKILWPLLKTSLPLMKSYAETIS